MYMSEFQKSSSNSGSHSMEVSKRVLRARSARSERSEPRERSEACSERSDEVRDYNLRITQTKDSTYYRLNTAHNTDFIPHITQTKTHTEHIQNPAHSTD